MNIEISSKIELANAPVDEADNEELAALSAYHRGDPEYQPVISQDDLLKELGLIDNLN